MKNLSVETHYQYYFQGLNSLVFHPVEISASRSILCVISYCHLESIHLSLQEHIFILGI